MKVLLAVSSLALGAGLISGATRPAVVPSVTLVRVPNGGIQPEVAVDDRGVIHLLYFSGDPRAGNLYYVRSRDSGATFSAPRKVNSQDGSVLATGTIRGGQLALGRNGRVHVTWYGSETALPRGLTNPGSGQSSPPLLYSHSRSDGTGFEPQRNLTRRTYGFDGGSVAADGLGNVYAVWHALAAGEPAGEDHRRLWVARSRDDGETFDDEQPAWREPTGACACCGTRALADPSNGMFVVYRSAATPTDRAIYLLQSNDRGVTFRGSRVQGWQIGTCPMSSMSLVSSDGKVLAAWERAGQVYWGEVDGQSARVPGPIAAPGEDSTRKHPRLALHARTNRLLVWTEGTAWARGGSLAWQIFNAAGESVGSPGTAEGMPAWSFAAAVARPDGNFVILY